MTTVSALFTILAALLIGFGFGFRFGVMACSGQLREVRDELIKAADLLERAKPR